MHHDGQIDDREFLRQKYPRFHMVLYDAVCTAGEARALLPHVAKKIRQSPQSAESIVQVELSKASTVSSRRALGLLKLLTKRGCHDVVRQLATPSVLARFRCDFEGIILQIIESGRWEKKYGRRVYDVVIAVPEFAKTIALSTTEIHGAVPAESFKVYDRLKLSNFHVYCFFNRAHAVRAREAAHVSIGTRVQELSKLKFLLRTANHAKIIARSGKLCMFTPLETAEGLRLAFYFATICRAAKVKSVPSASGFGFDLSQSDIVFEDNYGTLNARMSLEVFKRSVEDPIQIQYTGGLKDPYDLEGYKGWILAVAAWFFADEQPHIAFLGFLGSDPAVHRYSALAYVNSLRKMKASDFKAKFGSPDPPLPNLVDIGEYVYYKEDHWPTDLFKRTVKAGFKNISFSESLRLGVSLSQYQEFCYKLRRFLEMRKDLKRLYSSQDPEEEFSKFYVG